jgi:ABC-type uncharacterized transport system substrate-binding protein
VPPPELDLNGVGNLAVEWRVTGNDPEGRAQADKELAAARLDAIFAGGIADPRPVRDVTETVPIVVVTGLDVIRSGLAQSLSQPGGNVTGERDEGEEVNGGR